MNRMRWFFVLSLFLPWAAPAPSFSSEPLSGEPLSGEIVIEGAAESRELLRELAWRFSLSHPEARVIVVPESIGTSGGIRKVKEGKTDLGRTSRRLTPKETAYGLTHEVFAQSPVVFVTNDVRKIDGLTYGQIVDIYSRQVAFWKQLGGEQQKIYFISREAGDSSRMALDARIPWFKGLASEGRTFFTSGETIEALRKHKNTIGYAAISTVVGTRLKVLRVNNVYPSIENVGNGRYKLVIPLGIVYREGGRGPLAAAFIDFLYSPEGRVVIRRYGCLPVERGGQ
jgi:phosphate transport system substrate-binding protein